MSLQHISAAVEHITPAQAAYMLALNGVNRNVRPSLVDRYAGVMARGGWVVNGEAIVIGESGRLLDGQHRLHAIVKYGAPVSILVVRGVKGEDEAFHTLNSGALRSSSDRLYSAGEQSTSLLAATLRMVYRYERGMTTNIALRGFTPDLLFSTLSEHGGVREWLTPAQLCNRVGFTPSIMALVFYGASKYNREKAEEFARQCESGEHLSADSPVYHLRKRIIAARGRRGLTQLSKNLEAAVYIKAWNAFAREAPMGKLSRAHNEDFPEILGFPMKRKPVQDER